MGFGNGMIHSVAGVDTSDPTGTLAHGIKAQDNCHHHDMMVTIAQQQLNHIAANIEYKDADTAVDPTDEEVDDTVDAIHRSIKRQHLTPDRVIWMMFGDLQLMYDHAN
jgi:hypothetical protein